MNTSDVENWLGEPGGTIGSELMLRMDNHTKEFVPEIIRKTLEKRLNLLTPFNIQFYYTDDYAVYDCLPKGRHRRGKKFTQLIEKTNPSLHTTSTD